MYDLFTFQSCAFVNHGKKYFTLLIQCNENPVKFCEIAYMKIALKSYKFPSIIVRSNFSNIMYYIAKLHLSLLQKLKSANSSKLCTKMAD